MGTLLVPAVFAFVIDLQKLLEANEFLRADIAQRLERVDEREARARAVLGDCEAERRELGSELAIIDEADRLYRRRFLPASDQSGEAKSAKTEDIEAVGRQHRARIGPQRYRILVALRKSRTALALGMIVLQTGLSYKRVRDQLRADLTDGFIAEQGGTFTLLQAGETLLERYESYKRAKGEPLPSLDEPISEDDGEDGESDAPSLSLDHGATGAPILSPNGLA